ncbi:hypothetical protein EAH89_17295 [Roseomonas nepalensis]|uniref:Uncharacterized protein n=1 Tax=Muricoccus nepalensis TaxID=1854500 RepID=A0A502FWG0_9PROT|nr:hypothetical protein [Roseomonas nepalensis]TPG53273.1 hypothetical protein EAH89_17295 [Roseomonas nepalensis]
MWLGLLSVAFALLAALLFIDLVAALALARNSLAIGLVLTAKLPAFLLAAIAHIAADGFANTIRALRNVQVSPRQSSHSETEPQPAVQSSPVRSSLGDEQSAAERDRIMDRRMSRWMSDSLKDASTPTSPKP